MGFILGIVPAGEYFLRACPDDRRSFPCDTRTMMSRRSTHRGGFEDGDRQVLAMARTRRHQLNEYQRFVSTSGLSPMLENQRGIRGRKWQDRGRTDDGSYP